MGISRLRLARDVIRLLIALVGLVKVILMLVSGATNYPDRCSAPTSTSSSSRTGIRYLSLRHLAAKLGQWSMWMCGAAGDHPTTSTIFVAAAMSRH
jgi:hypothetical protein